MTFVASVPARALGALSALRSARVFHPEGVLLDGVLELQDASSPTVRALGGPAEHAAVVRVSRAVGTPAVLPDIWGLALRVTVDGHLVDLLLATIGRRRVTSHVLAPAGGWLARPYSTLLPLRADDVRVTLGLRCAGGQGAREPDAVRAEVRRRPVRFTLFERREGRWSQIGGLVLAGPWDGGQVSYDPLANTHPRLRHTRTFADLRARAYRRSRRGRGAVPGSLARTPAP